MKIPKRIKILYKNYTIEYADNLHDDGEDLYGQIQYLPERILLNSAASEEQHKATLIHEVLHGMDELHNIGLEENQVKKLGVAFYMLIKNNPEMFEVADD